MILHEQYVFTYIFYKHVYQNILVLESKIRKQVFNWEHYAVKPIIYDIFN